jgi:hypothetical protein
MKAASEKMRRQTEYHLGQSKKACKWEPVIVLCNQYIGHPDKNQQKNWRMTPQISWT